jgi:hypothetical protein
LGTHCDLRRVGFGAGDREHQCGRVAEIAHILHRAGAIGQIVNGGQTAADVVEHLAGLFQAST